jgi:geranylgeranyl reductase family protein
MQFDIAIIGGGPGGSAAAISAARAGLRVVLCEKGPYGRDKVCGDGLTPRAIAALNELGIDHSVAHRIDGLRMIAGNKQRELAWPTTDRFPNHGAVWPRQRFDNHLLDVAIAAGADVRFNAEAMPVIEDSKVVGITVNGEVLRSSLVILATGAQGAAAKMLGAVRDPDETFGLAIRAYAPTPRHAERHLEACLSLRDEHGTPIPGYGWMFPAGDGTVNIGVGALSTMKGFKKLNLNTLLDQYASIVRDSWSLGNYVDKPRAWRLPMSCVRRHGQGWVAIGDAAGFVNPMNGEGIDYALESGRPCDRIDLVRPASG